MSSFSIPREMRNERVAVLRRPAGDGGRALRVLAVTNMYPSRERPTSGIFLEEQMEGLRRLGLSVDVFVIQRWKEGARSYFGVGRRVLERVREVEPDLVHVLYGGVLADSVTRAIRDRPVFVTFHGSDLQGSVLAPLRVRLMAAYGVLASRRAARRAYGIVPVSEHLLELLPEGIDPDRLRVVPCGIDLSRFEPRDRSACRRALGWDENSFHVLFATNNDDPIKRPELARQAVESLNALGVPATLHVLRGVSYAEVPLWLNAADVVLLTSRTEGSPTVVKEALACDRPVVSVRVGDVPHQIGGIAGCFLTEATPEALAGALARVAEGPRKVDGRERAARYDSRRIAEQLRDFYERRLERWERERIHATGSRSTASGAP